MMPPLMTVGSKPAGVEQRRHQRRRRRLAVGAGDGDALLQPHQLGEHFGPPHHRNAPRPRRRQLGIVALDRGRDDDHRRLAEMRGVMADEDGRAVLAQPLDVGVVAGVRALHLVAEIDQHLGDAGHADAADADEMDGAKLARQFHEASLLAPPAVAGAAAKSPRHKPNRQFGQIEPQRRR